VWKTIWFERDAQVGKSGPGVAKAEKQQFQKVTYKKTGWVREMRPIKESGPAAAQDRPGRTSLLP
jgi:hypothetical protein